MGECIAESKAVAENDGDEVCQGVDRGGRNIVLQTVEPEFPVKEEMRCLLQGGMLEFSSRSLVGDAQCGYVFLALVEEAGFLGD